MNPLVAGLGLGLVLLGCLAYESETRRLQTFLTELWIRVDDLAITGIGRHAAIMRIAATRISEWLANVFGDNSFSRRSIRGSLIASSLSILAYYLYEELFSPIVDLQLLLKLIIAFLAISYALRLHLRSERPRVILCILASLFLALVPYSRDLFSTGLLYPWLDDGVTWFEAGTALALTGVLITFYSIIGASCLRYLIRRTSGMVTLGQIALATLLGLLLAVFLVASPYFLYDTYSASMPQSVETIVDYVTSAAFPLALLSLSTLLLAQLMLLHQLIWPLLSRPLYQIASLEPIRLRNALFVVGSLLIAASFPFTQPILAFLSTVLFG